VRSVSMCNTPGCFSLFIGLLYVIGEACVETD